MELQGRNVVITGAGSGSGIGRALAERFAREQSRALVVADLDEAAVREVARGIGAIAVRTDVSSEEEIVALVERARSEGARSTCSAPTPGCQDPAADPRPPTCSGSRSGR